ncbi:MAG TPA: lysylphosphatidylglycerol synthase transmembrane domain-containing protein [Solirubrobacteraceae bacterium]
MTEDHATKERSRVPVSAPEPDGGELGEDTGSHELPRIRLTRGRILASIVFVLSMAAFLYFVLPKILGLKETWNRLGQGDVWWLVIAAFLELLSFASYVALFRAVFVRDKGKTGKREPKIGWRESYQITMAGVAATRLFAAAGAGGVALTAWALTRSGMRPRIVACRMVAFLVLLYGVYMATFVIVGLGLYFGVFEGPAPFAATVIPAIFGGVVIVLFLAMALIPGDLERLVARWTTPDTRFGRAMQRLAALPATAATGIRTAIGLVRTKDPYLLGAVGWWGFDIAVLWACFHAFGHPPPQAVIVMCYFIGMLGNTLPLPGGIGGVDGGMIGAFTAFGVNAELAVVSVLAYRAFAFWLPTIPGAIAYLQLRKTVQRWRSEGREQRGSEAPSASEAPSYT